MEHLRKNVLHDENLSSFVVLVSIYCAGILLVTFLGTKIATIGSLYVPAGIVAWCITFPITDIVAEVYGREYAKRLVLGGLIVIILSQVMSQLAVLLPAAPFWEHQDKFEFVMNSNARTSGALIVSYLITQYVDVYLFAFIRRKTSGRMLWLRNNGSTFVSQLLANCIFLSIAFGGTIPWVNWWSLFQTNLIARIGFALIDTPIVYASVFLLFRLHPDLKAKAEQIS